MAPHDRLACEETLALAGKNPCLGGGSRTCLHASSAVWEGEKIDVSGGTRFAHTNRARSRCSPDIAGPNAGGRGFLSFSEKEDFHASLLESCALGRGRLGTHGL